MEWSALMRWLWGTESKAFLTSKKTAAIFEWLTSMFCQVSVTWVDDMEWKPNWMLLRSL